jgi:hypothetical protein
MEFKEFKKLLDDKIKDGDEYYLKLLEKILNNPTRYSRRFLISGKDILIRDITRSKEIKFVDFLEELVTDYLEENGFDNLNRNIKNNESIETLKVNQLFSKDETIYFIDQKIRDYHNSTKRVEKFSNFIKKIKLLREQNPAEPIVAIMWFMDVLLIKNKAYYSAEMNRLKCENIEIHLFYGEDLFRYLKIEEAWSELVSFLSRMEMEIRNELDELPDFDKGDEIYQALTKLSKKLWEKLVSNEDIYVSLRNAFFPTSFNLERAKEIRDETI